MPIHHFNFSSWFCTSIWKSLLTHILQSFSHLQNDKCENSLEATNISSLAWHMLYDIWKFCVYKLSEHFWATSPFWLEKEMATHSSVLAWRIPETREPGGLLSMGSHRVGHDWSDLAAVAAAVSIYVLDSVIYFTYIAINFDNSEVKGNGTPLQYSCLVNPMDRGAW